MAPKRRERDDSDSETWLFKATPPRRHRFDRRRMRNPWQRKETEELYRMVMLYGEGSWALIKENGGFPGRSAVDLKDRWRNVTRNVTLFHDLRVKFGKIPNQ